MSAVTAARPQEPAIPSPAPARMTLILLAPGLLLLFGIFVLPLLGLGLESLRQYVPGRVGSAVDAPLTLENYRELATASFAGVLYETFKLSAAASLVGLLAAFPLAYCIVRRFSPRQRAACIGLLVMLVLLSMLVRTYALELAFGSVGIARPLLLALGISPTSRGYIEVLVGAGLLHAVMPICTLTLLGTIQNIDPRLCDAAQSLGAPAWKAHLGITVPLALPGLVSAFLIAMTFAISAFVIPMVLGKGRVLFLSNTIYTRFSDVANYPSGAAVSIAMLVISLVVLSLASLAHRRKGARS